MIKVNLSEYFQIIKPKYTILKITPDKSIRNYNSTVITKSIQIMYKPIYQRLNKIKKEFKLTYKEPEKCCFIIDIVKNNVNFYFLIPQFYENLFREKLNEVWPKATLEIVDILPKFSKECAKYELCYSREDPLSLNTDKRCNEPLNSILSILDVLNEEDHVGIYYNFMPSYQKAWRKIYNETINKLKAKEPVDREKFNLNYALKEASIITVDLLDYVLNLINSFFGGKEKEKIGLAEIALSSLVIDDIKKISKSTLNKKDKTVLNTQQLILSDSKDKISANNNAVAVCESFKVLNEDNELIYKKINKDIDPFAYSFPAEINRMSVDECQNFIEIPGRELLQQHKIIKNVNVFESELPKQLQNGSKRIGSHMCKGTETMAYFTKDKDYRNLAFVYVGPTRSGKTTGLCNLSYDSIKNKECVIVLDFIENCGLSDSIKEYIDKDKILEIDLGTFKHIEGLGYNELDIETDDPLEKYNNAKLKTNQLEYLINSINDDSDLKARMERYLDAASIIVFINNGPIKDVFQVLQDHVLRHKYIDSIQLEQRENVEDYVSALEELDEWSKATKDTPAQVISTKYSLVQGILNRVNKLKKNTILELMLKKDTKDNINLSNEIQKNKAILIKMPENRFGTPEERDIMVTYWLTKIWLALQIRAANIPDRYRRNTVSIITDELNQLTSAQYFVGEKLSQCAKFGGKFIISTMYLNELKIRDKLRTANTSYILISGSDKTNFKELKEEFEQQGFTLEDLFNLPRHFSLDLIKYEEGYWAGITHLPPPIK
jgi:hypothetical protein